MPIIERERESKKGFTLVELLVVIAIIAVLSAVGLVAFSSAQKSGRIGKRIQDLKAIQTALEVYYSVNKAYPSSGGSWRNECSGWAGNLAANDVIPGLVPTYMVSFPSDPAMDKGNHRNCYMYNSNGTDYKLIIQGVTDMTSAELQRQKNLIDPNRDGGSSNCKVDGANIAAWAIWSSCQDTPSCSGSCTW
ncbi:type II secretion system protein [Candidatus Daviesbacteria bacterium]|nr:type II secretion system protein [Candidatus Daviesbacteria bacterium]